MHNEKEKDEKNQSNELNGLVARQAAAANRSAPSFVSSLHSAHWYRFRRHSFRFVSVVFRNSRLAVVLFSSQYASQSVILARIEINFIRHWR